MLPKKRPPPAPPPQPFGVVYYVRFADRIKIGTTTNLERRLHSLPHDELLATEVGDYQLERQRHQQFHRSRCFGEWFYCTPDLLQHIESLKVPA